MSPSAPAATTGEYLRMAEELEAMAATVALDRRLNHHFAERLLLLAKQMREDSARLAPAASASPSEPAAG